MLHPLLVVSLREVVSGMGSSGLLSVLSCEHGHLGLYHQILQLHGLHQVSVPDVAAVTDAEVMHNAGVVMQLCAALLQIILPPEHCSILLHGLLHAQSNFGGWFLAL